MTDLKWVPNALSIFRIGLAALFPFLPATPGLRTAVVGIAILTEFFDGFLARRWNAESKLGQLLDPVADKLFVLSVIFVLIVEHKLMPVDFLLLASRDIVVSIGALSLWFEARHRSLEQFKPRMSGKIATALQFLTLLILIAEAPLQHTLLKITMTASALAAVDYLYCVLHRRFDRVAS